MRGGSISPIFVTENSCSTCCSRHYAQAGRRPLEDLLPIRRPVLRAREPAVGQRQASRPSRRRLARERDEVPGGMSLICEAAFRGDPGPTGRGPGPSPPAGVMEANHPRKGFGANTELGTKSIDEVLAAPADLLRQGGDPGSAAVARQTAIRESKLRGRQVGGATQDEILEDVEAVLPAAGSAQALAQPRALLAEHVTDLDHAGGEVDDGAAEKTISTERRKIHLHAFGAAVGLDVHGSDMKSRGEAALLFGCIRFSPERDEERRAEADDQRHDQRCGLALTKPATHHLAVTGHSRDQTRHPLLRHAAGQLERDRSCDPRHPALRRSRAFSASIESKRGSGFLDLTRFLDASRFPLRLKTL